MPKNKNKKSKPRHVTNTVSHERIPMAVRLGIALDPSVPVSKPAFEPESIVGSGLNVIRLIKKSTYELPIL